MLFRKTAAAGPVHVEIWGQIEAHARFWRRLALAALAWSFLALALAAWSVRAAYFEPIAYQVTPEGQAAYVGALRSHAVPSEGEQRYLAKLFLRKAYGWNSLTIADDLQDASRLMTAEAQQQQRLALESFAKDTGRTFAEEIARRQTQTRLEFEDERTEIQNHGDKMFTVRLRGQAKTWPLSRVGDDTAVAVKEFEAVVTLVTCPRTEETPNGLLVAKIAYRNFRTGAEEEATVQPLEAK